MNSLSKTFLYKPELNCLHPVKWFQVLFGLLVVFYGISTLVGYLMSNPLYT